MSKFTCLVLCIVAASVSRSYASDEDKAAFREAIKPIIDECSKEHGVSDEDIKSAKTAGSAESIKPCFLGCVFKKTEVLNAKGEYDADKALTQLKKFVPDETKFAKYVEIGKKCESVNEKPVSDGEAGCERGAMLTACFLENRAEIDSKGNYNVDSGLKILREYVKDDVQYNNIAAVARACASVKDKPVTDGTAGCERGSLAAECLLAHQASFII